MTVPANAVAHYARQKLHLAIRDEDLDRALKAAMPAHEPGKTENSPRIDAIIGSAFTWLGWTVGTDDVDSCSRLFFREATAHLTVYDDARALLSSLKFRGYRVGVITNAIFPGHLFQPLVNELGLSGYVDAFVSSADLGVAKPNPGIFLHTMKAIGCEAHETLFVGDRLETDIAGARAAGMRAVLIRRGARPRDASGYLVIEHLSALNDLLGENPV
ncbi:MAG: HAD family hydrolase, partial [Anaerolineaceae bacterium]